MIVKRIKVSKGLSVQRDKNWERYELGYEIEGSFEDETQIDTLENNALGHIEERLRKWTEKKTETTAEPFDINKIEWHETQGKSGPFQRSVDRSNPHFKNCVNLLALSEKRSLVIDGYYVWLFKDNRTLGRKPAQL